MSRRSKRLAFSFGFFFGIALVYSRGVLAAVTIAEGYFAYFGRQRATLARVLEEAATIALPVVIFTQAWGYVLLRPMRPSSCKAILWRLAGLLVVDAAFNAYVLQQFADIPMPEGVRGLPLETAVLGRSVPFPWSILPIVAAPPGLVIARPTLLRSRDAPPSAKKPPAASAVGA
jgi:hypothetical protein